MSSLNSSTASQTLNQANQSVNSVKSSRSSDVAEIQVDEVSNQTQVGEVMGEVGSPMDGSNFGDKIDTLLAVSRLVGEMVNLAVDEHYQFNHSCSEPLLVSNKRSPFYPSVLDYDPCVACRTWTNNINTSVEVDKCIGNRIVSGASASCASASADQVSASADASCVSASADQVPASAGQEDDDDQEVNSVEEIECMNAQLIRCGLINSRGFASKECSIRNIMVDEMIQVLFIVETQTTQNDFPKIPGYFTFYRNREKRRGGGVAIVVDDEFKGRARLVDMGKGDLESITVVLTGFDAPVQLTCYYGQQENTQESGAIRDHLATLVGGGQVASDEGALVCIAGDCNVKTGDLLVKNNPNKQISPGGRVLVDMLAESDLKCVNDKDKEATFTHVDRSAKTSNVLDYLITNCPDLIQDVEVDTKFVKTPFYTRIKPGGDETVYTDHCTITWNILVTGGEDEEPRPKVKKVRYSKPGGAEEYRKYLEEDSARLTEIVVSSDTTKATSEILKSVEEAKKLYGKTTVTAAKLERMEESKLWMKRYTELNEFVEEAKEQPGKEMHRIFFARKQINNKLRYEQPSALKNLETGEILTGKDEINKYTLEYNDKLLQKQPPSGEWGKERERRSQVVKDLIELEDEESREPLTFQEFEEAVFEIIDKKKDCYIDFLRSGPAFKMVIFGLIQKIYLTGEVPSEFKRTNLMKLYKKGDRKLLSNYRFLHLKHWLPKITEKVVMKRIKKKMSTAVPHEQLGGVKGASCEEHLVELTTVMNIQTRRKRATATTFMDVVKCFDRVSLDEVCYQAGQAGVVGKPLRVLKEINSDTKMTIVGDESGESFTARDTVGQGLVSACEGSGLAMGVSLHRAMQAKTNHIMINTTRVEASAFVDDAAQADESSDGVRSTGKCLTDTLDELGLEAHPTKSVRVTCGPAAQKRKLMEELKKNPQEIQGTVIKDVEEERYLGLIFTNKNPRKNITRNIEDKRAKVLVKVKVIKKLLKHPVMQRLGWMRAAVGLIQSIVVQTILYGTVAFINMTAQQVKDLEKLQKDAIYDILGLSKYANYNAVLSEIGILRMEDSVKLRKTSFINKLMFERESCKCRDILNAEDSLETQVGLLDEVRKYCEEFGLPDVTKIQLRKNEVKETIKVKSVRRTWLTLAKSDKVLMRWVPEKNSNREYFSYTPLESKLMLSLMIGELNFLTNRKQESIKKLGSTRCFVGVCGGEDTLDHVSQCFGYQATPSGDGSERSQVEYLLALNEERTKKYKRPLIFYDKVYI